MKRCTTGMIAFMALSGVWGGMASETMTAPHRLQDLTVRPERDLLAEPARESAALEFTRFELNAAGLESVKPASASDALKAVPGIHTETRGRKYKQFHSFRGQIYPYPDIMLDGVWQREARELFYVYPGAAIERVEITRSAATLFSGLADVVGLINLVPRGPGPDPEAPPQLELGIEAGTFKTVRAYGYHESRADDRGALSLGGQYFRTDGRSGRNAGEALSSLFGAWHFEPAANHRLVLSAWVLHGERELEMPDPDGPAQNNLKNRRERYDPLTYGHVRLRGFHRASANVSTDWSLFFSDRRARYVRRKIDPDGPGPGHVEADEDDREYGAQIIRGWAWRPDNTLRLGVFAHRWTAPEGKQSYVGARQDVSSFALVLADEQVVGNWTLDGGLRYARSYLHDFSAPAFDITGQSTQSRTVEDQWDDPVLSGTLGAALSLDAANRLYAHGGAGERRPGPGAVRPDGASPSAERRYTADAGWALAWGADLTGRMQIGGFGIWRPDAIVRVNETGLDAAGNEYYFSGNRDIRQQGLEAELQTPPVWQDRLAGYGGVTWMRSEIETGGRYETYREIPSRILSAGLRAAVGAWDGALGIKHVDGYENFRFAQNRNYHDLGDYWDVSLSGGVRLGAARNIRLYGIVDNLLDDQYSTVVGWSDPGRRYRLGLESSF